MANKYAGIVQSGVYNYLTSAAELNGYKTDMVSPGVVGTVGNTSGVAPSTGSFAVNAQGTPNMTVAVSSGQAYVNATPTSGTAQVVRATSDATENVTISANSTGSTKYDFVYIKIDPDKMNNPSVAGTDVVTLITSRSSSQASDSNGTPSNSLLLAVVTVTNGASSIANSDIADYRIPMSLGWISANETWTYASASSPQFTCTVSGDVSGKYNAGMKVMLWQTTKKYFIITKVAYSAGSTTLTLYGGTDYTLANATIVNPCFSMVRVPQGFPMDKTKWTVKVTDTSSRVQATPVSGTWYNLGSISITIPTGCWDVDYKVHVYFPKGAATDAYTTLSTANNSESDTEFSTRYDVQANSDPGLTLWHGKTLTLTSSTAYYLNTKTGTASVSNIYNNNDQVKLVIRAICAYL